MTAWATIIPLADIIIPPNRQRTEFDQTHLRDLETSILSKGLLHAIVVRNDGKTLIAGECRLRVITKLAKEGKQITFNGMPVDPESIPVVALGDLDSYQVQEAELEENIRRKDLTIQERALAVAALHRLRIQQHGNYDPATREGWTQTKTAEELVRRRPRANEINDVAEALLIADNMDDPFVAAAADKKAALRAVRDRKTVEHRNRLLDEFKQRTSRHQLIKGSCYEVLTNPEFRNRFSVIIADPPYGINADKTSTFDNTEHEYDDSEEAFQEVCNLLPALSHTVATEQAHIYVFCDIVRFPELYIAFELSGWTVWKRPLIWNKGNIGSYGNIDVGFRKTYDAILFANKGGRPMNGGYRDIVSVNQRTDLPHPAGKPSELYRELLSYSVLPGDNVLDPYCGHGPIFPAAQDVNCIATGIEKHDFYYPMSVETLSKIKE